MDSLPATPKATMSESAINMMHAGHFSCQGEHIFKDSATSFELGNDNHYCQANNGQVYAPFDAFVLRNESCLGRACTVLVLALLTCQTCAVPALQLSSTGRHDEWTQPAKAQAKLCRLSFLWEGAGYSLLTHWICSSHQAPG